MSVNDDAPDVLPTSSLRLLPLNALRSFDAAARRLSFASAARELGVTPAAISVQVRRLETWVGAALFVRGHRSIALSAVGRKLGPRLTALFVEMERLLAEVADLDASVLRVSAMPSFASKWLAPRLGGFVAAHPALQVRVTGADRRSDFDRDDVDVGLRYGGGGLSGVQSRIGGDLERLSGTHPGRAPAPGRLFARGARLADLERLVRDRRDRTAARRRRATLQQ